MASSVVTNFNDREDISVEVNGGQGLTFCRLKHNIATTILAKISV